MKKVVFFLVSISLLISACSVGAATPAEMSQPAQESILASPTIQPTFTKIPPLAPTSTLALPAPAQILLPTETPLPLPQMLSSSVIQFALGGTWKDTQGSLPAGASQTYTLNAMQGQIMSVSIMGGYFPLQIRGRDGTVLCPVDANTECGFWRGTLPLSQDYYITVKSGGLGENFNLRVAINPPGKSAQMFTYTDSASGISLSYSDQFAPADKPSSLNNKTDLHLALHLIDTSSYINTNLGEAYIALGSSSNAQVLAACTEFNQSGGAPEVSNGNVVVNGYTFAYSTASGVGAGNIYDQHIYRIAKSGICHEVIFFIHYSNIGNYSPGVVKEFDLQGLMGKMNGILTTMQMR